MGVKNFQIRGTQNGFSVCVCVCGRDEIYIQNFNRKTWRDGKHSEHLTQIGNNIKRDLDIIVPKRLKWINLPQDRSATDIIIQCNRVTTRDLIQLIAHKIINNYF